MINITCNVLGDVIRFTNQYEKYRYSKEGIEIRHHINELGDALLEEDYPASLQI